MGHISLEEVTYLYIWLGGRGVANTAPGFTVFLKRSGVRRPTLTHLSSEHIAAYWEYVAQLYGLLEAADAMRAIKQFWQWCAQNKYIPLQPVPADLIGNSVIRPYRHKLKIVKPTPKRGHSYE